jgi:hemoglobin
MKTRNSAGSAAAAALLSLVLVGAASAEEKAAGPSLYERLGGVGPISVVVDEFIDRLAADKVLNANPAIKAARARVPKSYLKFHVTTLVCQVTGGPCKYTGRGMKESHAHLNITEKEWAQMASVFKSVLDKYKVPGKEQEELFAVVGTTKGDIVAAGPKVDAGKVKQYLAANVTYPVTRSELVAACKDVAGFSADEKTWFAAKLPEGTYRSAKEVAQAIGLR